jgi:hypothetical protein
LLVLVVPGNVQDTVTLGVLELSRASLSVGTAEPLLGYFNDSRDDNLSTRGPSLGYMCRAQVQGEEARMMYSLRSTRRKPW